MLVMMFTFSITNAQSYTRKGDSFTQVSTKTSNDAIKTKFTWTDSKGKSYPIFVTNTGRCYINKVSSKTGKEYKYYLKEDIAREVCKELGITYKEKK
jgi:hypothetical protein